MRRFVLGSWYTPGHVALIFIIRMAGSAAPAAGCSSLLTVGEIEDGCALLASDDLHVIRLPLALLPEGTTIGQVINLTATRSVAAEQQRVRQMNDLQAELAARLGPAPGSVSTAQHDVLSS